MLTHSSEERLAVLLSILGDDASKTALNGINPTRAVFVNKLLEEYKADPPSKEEVEFVLQDFQRFFDFALTSMKPKLEVAQNGLKGLKGAKGQKAKKRKTKAGNDDEETRVAFEPITESGDYISDINRLDAYQVSQALSDEHPNSVAIVLGFLEASIAASVLKYLDDDLRNKAIACFCDDDEKPERVVQKVLKSTFLKANAVLVRKESIERSDVLASLMRSLPRTMRSELIETLSEQNEEFVQSVKSKLYVFDDLLRLDDRDTQKLISETQSDNLIVALQDCEEDIVEKILSNLSKRARQAIEVEIEYQTGVSPEEIEAARTALIETLASLDESGVINLS